MIIEIPETEATEVERSKKKKGAPKSEQGQASASQAKLWYTEIFIGEDPMKEEHTVLDLDVKMAEKVAHGLALATLLPSDMKT
uniref:Uncharacterized protein n=1 Tax=Fagus sylvatica TaxID=28930 RepID=A0A2N9GM92_FAGSY